MIEERIMSRDQIEKMINSKIRKIDTFFLARITRYDPVRNVADIQPLEKIFIDEKTIKDQPLILNCPVMIVKSKDFYLRIPYSKGDVVYCGCCKDVMENLLITGEPELNLFEEERKFSFNEAVILGGILVSNEEQLSSSDSGSFLIENRNNGAKISFNQDGTLTIDKTNGVVIKDNTSISLEGPNISIKGEVKIDGGIDHKGDMKSSGSHTVSDVEASGDVVAGAISLVNHTHKYNPGPGTPKPTMPPE